MSVTTQISLQEYLDMEFQDGTPEYLDGELAERPMTSTRHAKVQGRFVVRLDNLCEPLGLAVYVEVPMRITAEKVRIADVAIFDRDPSERVAENPPLLIVEVLSPSDTWKELRQRIRDYLGWGVANIWLADPETRELFVVAASADTRQVPALELPDHGIRITPDDVF